MSVSMRLTIPLVRAIARLGNRGGPEALVDRLTTRAEPVHAKPSRSIRARFDIAESVVRGRPVLRLTPKSGSSGDRLVYWHGGAYVEPFSQFHWSIVDQLTRKTGVSVTVPLYNLAPSGGVDDGLAFASEVYAAELADVSPDRLSWAGDSAGGGLALASALALRDEGLVLPRQLILLSPWVELAMTNPKAVALQPRDPMLAIANLQAAARLWAGARAIDDWRVSPALAESLSGLPPVHQFVGGRDVLSPDELELHRRLVEAGNAGSLTYEPSAFHVYLGASWTPESKSAISQVRHLLTS